MDYLNRINFSHARLVNLFGKFKKSFWYFFFREKKGVVLTLKQIFRIKFNPMLFNQPFIFI
jgi:hypothetical protein